MNQVLALVHNRRGNRTGVETYEFYESSYCSMVESNTIPVCMHEDKTHTGAEYSALGLANFYPYHLSDNNPSDNNDFARVMKELLEMLKHPLNLKAGKYPLFRGDINVFMAWIRV